MLKMGSQTDNYLFKEHCIYLNTGESLASNLPLEVVTHLMEFLSYSDRVAASQVCQLWYEAFLHPKFLNQEKVVIKKSATEAFSVFKNTTRPYLHFILIEIELNNKTKDFWAKIAPGIKSLYFESCDLNEKTLVQILLNAPNLETLVLANCRELFMPGQLLNSPDDVETLRKSLHKLKELNLSSNRYLSDAMFNRLMAAMPHLDTVSLESCQISYHAGLFKKYYPDQLTADDADYASETVLTFRNFYNIVHRRAQDIKNINLSRTLVDSNALTILSQLSKLELNELYLVGCEQLTNTAIISLAQHQSSLTVLDMSYCSRVTDQALLQVCTGLRHLRKLAVRNCRAITDLGIVQLKNLSHLEALDISQCDQVTGAGIQDGLCSAVNRKLLKLVMEGLSAITASTVILLAETFPSLTHLNLSYCFNAVTDISIQAIFQHQVRLRSLRLASCDAVTDAGLTGMGMGATVDNKEVNKEVVIAVDQMVLAQPRLKISLRSRAEEEIIRDAYRKKAVQKMCESQLMQSTSVGYSLARLQGLQELDLHCCNKITDVSLKYSFRFPELQHLNLSQCQQITHVGLLAIGENNPSIDTLNLGQCYNVTDDGILALTRALHRLKYLDIKGCNQLTEASAVAILDHCRQLRYLDATHCNKMSDKIATSLHRLPLQTFYSRSDSSVVPPMAPPLPRH